MTLPKDAEPLALSDINDGSFLPYDEAQRKEWANTTTEESPINKIFREDGIHGVTSFF